MNVSELLSPLVEKAITKKGYIREVAVERSRLWLAKELGVPVTCLHNLSYEQEWQANAVVEKALLPPPRKRKKKIDIPEPEQRFFRHEDKPLGDSFWRQLEREWGSQFFAAFFGDWVDVRPADGLLSAGQYVPEVIKRANKVGLFDAA